MLYAFRRYLKLSVAEVRALPWWEFELLLEGMAEEFKDPDAREEGDFDDLASLGVDVRTV